MKTILEDYKRRKTPQKTLRNDAQKWGIDLPKIDLEGNLVWFAGKLRSIGMNIKWWDRGIPLPMFVWQFLATVSSHYFQYTKLEEATMDFLQLEEERYMCRILLYYLQCEGRQSLSYLVVYVSSLKF